MKRQILLSKQLRLLSRSLTGALILLIISNPARAQQVIIVKAGMITYAEGEVFKDNEAVEHVGKEIVALKNGQTLRTDMGRAELLLSPNVYLRVGENSSLRMERDLLDDTRLALERGSALIEVVQAAKGNFIHVRCGKSLIEIARNGLYRLHADPGELRVHGGTAGVTNGKDGVSVKRGRMVRLDGSLAISEFDLDLADPLHEWAARRSFYFFGTNSKSGWRMRNWTPVKGGGLYNAGFRMCFYWKSFIDAHAAQQEPQDGEREEQP